MSNYRNNDLDRFAGLFKALANPNRLRIFLRLVSCCPPGQPCDIEAGRACIGDLGADLELAPSTVSHHIKELNRAGLIEMQRSGQKIECWIPAERLADLAEFFGLCCQGTVQKALQLPDRDFTRS